MLGIMKLEMHQNSPLGMALLFDTVKYLSQRTDDN
jgi:hypothetical protein